MISEEINISPRNKYKIQYYHKKTNLTMKYFDNDKKLIP